MVAFASGITWKPSPHYSSREGFDVEAVLIHYTAAGRATGTVRWFQMEESRVSAHFVISRDGDIFQLVDLELCAWHAGASTLDGIAKVNQRTIGIELANHGLLVFEGDEWFYKQGRELKPYKRAQPEFASLYLGDELAAEGWWEPYPDAQIAALERLLGKLKREGYCEVAETLLGHDEVAEPVGRKIDPGPLFPWEKFKGKLKADEP